MAWKYLPVLNTCIQIVLTVGLGCALGFFKVFKMEQVPTLVKFVFHVALPCLVVKGIGIGVDFYDDRFVWEYIFSFLILRALAFLASVLVVLIFQRERGVGEVVVQWLALTWISTVILGVPILTSVYGSPQLGNFYGLLAGISSFIFQLPLMLFLLEVHSAQRAMHASTATIDADADADATDATDATDAVDAVAEVDAVAVGAGAIDAIAADADTDGTHNTDAATADGGNQPHTVADNGHDSDGVDVEAGPPKHRRVRVHSRPKASSRVVMWELWDIGKRPDVWRAVALRVLRNPVLWGIFWGFVISLSTLGPKYLRPTSPDFVQELGWVWETLGWLGACTTPVSLFSMGVWMQHRGARTLIDVGLLKISLYMLSKLVLVPMLMVGIARMLKLESEPGRAAVLIATLPISMASFSLGKQYGVGEGFLAANVSVGTLLMLPTVIIWVTVMDAVDLFVV